MRKIRKFISKNFNKLLLILLGCSLLFAHLAPAYARYMDRTTEGNKKEQQLLKKIQIIHEAFPQQTDVAALYATITHRAYLTDYVNDAYDANFDEDKFREEWAGFKNNVTSVPTSIPSIVTSMLIDPVKLIQLFMDLLGSTTECLFESMDPYERDKNGNVVTDENGKAVPNTSSFDLTCIMEKLIDKQVTDPEHDSEDDVLNAIKQPQSIDLLTAATIVMLDSSGWFGSYSDDKYHDALAGTGLVGNLVKDDDHVGKFFASVFNGMFCMAGAAADIATNGQIVKLAVTGFDPTKAFTEYSEMGTEEYLNTDRQKLSRYYTMARICDKGYIGGIYQSVQNLEGKSAEDTYQLQKNQIADEIIALAQEFRGKGGINNCIVAPGMSGASDGWKQWDPTWSSNQLGSSKTIGSSGCLVTSVAMLMARSGTQLTNASTFNPAVLVDTLNNNGGFSGNDFTWTGYQSLAPNWRVGDSVSISTSDSATLANKIQEELSTPAEGQYQKFIVVQIYHDGGSQHWVAVTGAQNGQLSILDPNKDGYTLDENYPGAWVSNSYRVMYATDVPFGSTGSASNITAGSTTGAATTNPASGVMPGVTTSTANYCVGGVASGDLLSFVASLEGAGTCNYNGRGEGTGYTAVDENDGAGITTAFGITERYDAGAAADVGYTNFAADLHNGCTDKTFIDQMYPKVMGGFEQTVRNDTAGLGLSEAQIGVLTSIIYNTGAAGSYKDILDRIKRYGVNSFEVFDCMRSYGCSWTASGVADGLVRRRMAEYEALVTGNLNAAKPTETYDYFQSIDTPAKLEEYKSTHWPSSRTAA